jgi:TPP-dependent pyruvate/acetoin dehydrogenase alpha subunit
MFDPELYRPKAEVEEWKKRDPIALFAARLRAAGMLDDADLATLEANVREEVERAVAFAESGGLEPVEELARFVYSEVPA